jgi:hypothetical protein
VEKIAKDNYGFIECCDRDERLFFHFSELTPRNHQVLETLLVVLLVQKRRFLHLSEVTTRNHQVAVFQSLNRALIEP